MVQRGPRVERAFRPGQVAQGRLTLTNDGDVPTRYAVEVSPGATLPLVGFSAEANNVVLTDLVQPGRSTTLRIPLPMPQDVAEGRKVVRVRIGEVGPGGDLANLLDEQFFSGLLRVEVPRPVEPPTPPDTEDIPLPGEALPQVQGRIVAVASPQQGREFQGGQRATVRVTYENTGRRPHAFSVIAWAGDLVGPGQIEPDTQGTLRGPTVQPGRQHTLEVPLNLPSDPALGFGPKDVLVMLVDLDPAGRFPLATYDVRGLPNLFSLAEIPALPPLPEPEAPALPEGLLPGDLQLLDPVATPDAARPGQTIELRLPFLNAGPVAPTIHADVFVLGPDGRAVATLPRQTFAPRAGAEAVRALRWRVPDASVEGSYGVRVFAWDPATFVDGDPSTYLLREEVLDVFRVEQAVPAVPAVRPPRLSDLGTPTIGFSPRRVETGQATAGTITIPNLADFPFTGLVRVNLHDLGGQFVESLVAPTALEFGARQPAVVDLQVDTSELMPGSYGLFISLQDALTGTQLLARSFPNVFEVIIPAALRGVNEFRVLRWFYNGVPEPMDLRLLRIGPPTPLPITKQAGVPTGGSVLLEHRGEGGEFNIGYGIASGRPIPRMYNQPFRFFIAPRERIAPHPVPTLVWVPIPASPWPTTAIAPAGRYDAQKYIDDTRTRQTVWQEWDDDVFEVPN